MRRHWWLDPLYWLLAAAPLVAAFWVFRALPEEIYITPTVAVPTGRAGVWVLPGVNALLAIILYVLMRQMAKKAQEKARTQERPTDIAQALSGMQVFLMAWLSGICGAVVYGYYLLDTGGITAQLIGRVSAFVPGLGTAAFAMGLPRATKDSTLALRWVYTVRSPQVWLKVHKLGTFVLYTTGAIMMGAAFLTSGPWAVLMAGFALFSALFILHVYARRLYEDEFRH